MTHKEPMANSPDHQDEPRRDERSLAEWVTFGVASCILVGIVGLVCYDWLTQSQSLPSLEIHAKDTFQDRHGQFYVPFKVTNTGGQTVDAVQILAELEVSGQATQTGEQQIDFLSGQETEEGAFVFTQDPRKGNLTLRIGSYKLP